MLHNIYYSTILFQSCAYLIDVHIWFNEVDAKPGFCLLKSKKAFMKASEEADVAVQAFLKADQDMANSRLVIEKVISVLNYLQL